MHFFRKSLIVGFSLGTLLATTGCAPILVGGAAITTASMVSDRRASGTVVTDGVLEKEIAYDISREKIPDSHINVNAYNGKILLTGEVPDEAAKVRAGELCHKPDTKFVQNELAVMKPATAGSVMSDKMLATKVRSVLLTTPDVPLSQMKVVVERGNVYLLGIVTKKESELVKKTILGIDGVKNAVLCFDVETPAMIRERFKDYKNPPVVE